MVGEIRYRERNLMRGSLCHVAQTGRSSQTLKTGQSSGEDFAEDTFAWVQRRNAPETLKRHRGITKPITVIHAVLIRL